MRLAITAALLLFLCVMIGCGEQTTTSSVERNETRQPEEIGSKKVEDQVVEVSCGQCQLEMQGNGCDLAIRFNGKSFFVDGSSIDDHGDAHGDDGLCNCIRKAKVSGEIVDGRFKATSFEVLSAEKEELEANN